VLGLWTLVNPDGTAGDKNKAAKVPPGFAQLLNRSADDFIAHFDKNKDGYLTKDELPPRLAANFERIDRNGDGKLDKQEVELLLLVLRKRFEADAKASTKPSTNPSTKPEVEQRVTQILERLDTNRDGKISREEAKGPLANQFDRLDTNRDGYLDKSELRRAVERFMAGNKGGPGRGADQQPITPQNRGPDFDALDRNADGRLTREELQGTPFAAEFDKIDTNKDGKIDRKEFTAYLKKKSAEKEPDKKGP
jgi:Ca2+-binding EF-hand superfamily protein